MQQILELLKIHFGYDSFRPGQEKVIDNVLQGKSTIVIMPTGGGKSLCYQLPALVLDGITIVISPLISLMKDQVDSLTKIGISATFINSSINQAETMKRIEDVKNGVYKLLYIAPERFYSAEFARALQDIKVSLFAIDEAHCISQWGHDFRPSYVKLKNAISFLGNPIVLALTATATPEVKKDIAKQLGLNDPEIVVTGFARPNLQFGVIHAADSQKPRLALEAIVSMPQGTGIVYVGTRARADSLLNHLLENNIEAVSYHAGMDPEERKWIQENFMTGKVKVIIATNAFGLGINKKDIRFVIHYDMPGTVEAYYQEAGRAGRDGRPSFCLMFYNSRDRHLQEFFIKGDNPPPEIILEIYETLKNYESDTVLLTYAELADMLSDQVPEMAIGTSLKILEREGFISRSHEKTGNAFVKIKKDFASILNSLSGRAKSQREILVKLFDRFGNELEKGWSGNFDEVAEILKLKKESIMRLVRKLSENGLIDYEPPFKGTEIRILKRVDAKDVNIDFSALKEKMKNAYRKLDNMEEYIYHFGCRQAFILDYFGDKNFERCGRCDNCLNNNADSRGPERGPTLNQNANSGRGFMPANTKKFHGHNFEARPVIAFEEDLSGKAGLATKLTQLETFELYNRGMSIDEMAQIRNLKPGTVVEHLCWLIEKGMAVDVNKFVDSKKEKAIRGAIKQIGIGRLAPVKKELGDNYGWDEIRLVMASMK